jgi:hypothetical protein
VVDRHTGRGAVVVGKDGDDLTLRDVAVEKLRRQPGVREPWIPESSDGIGLAAIRHEGGEPRL